jgi:hypothetical protein
VGSSDHNLPTSASLLDMATGMPPMSSSFMRWGLATSLASDHYLYLQTTWDYKCVPPCSAHF